MTWALIIDDKVHELFAERPVLHPSLELVEVDASVEAGWLRGEDGTMVPPPAPPEPDLAAYKALVCARLDAEAEAVRARYITVGSGQAMTYMAKAAEAAAAVAEEDPEPADYPLLSAEVGITAATLAEVAAVVLAAHRDWQVMGAAIEAARLGGKAAVMAAEDAVAAAAAAAAVSWPGGPLDG